MPESRSDIGAAKTAAEALVKGNEGAAIALERLSVTELAHALQFCRRPTGDFGDLGQPARDAVRALLDARLAATAQEQSEALVKATHALEQTIEKAAKASGRLAWAVGIATAVIGLVGAVAVAAMFE